MSDRITSTQIHKPAGRPNWLLAAFLAAYCLLFTVTYIAFKSPYIHEVMKWASRFLSPHFPNTTYLVPFFQTMFLLLVFSLLFLGAKTACRASSSSPGDAARSPWPNRLFGLGILL